MFGGWGVTSPETPTETRVFSFYGDLDVNRVQISEYGKRNSLRGTLGDETKDKYGPDHSPFSRETMTGR